MKFRIIFQQVLVLLISINLLHSIQVKKSVISIKPDQPSKFIKNAGKTIGDPYKNTQKKALTNKYLKNYLKNITKSFHNVDDIVTPDTYSDEATDGNDAPTYFNERIFKLNNKNIDFKTTATHENGYTVSEPMAFFG